MSNNFKGFDRTTGFVASCRLLLQESVLLERGVLSGPSFCHIRRSHFQGPVFSCLTLTVCKSCLVRRSIDTPYKCFSITVMSRFVFGRVSAIVVWRFRGRRGALKNDYLLFALWYIE